jgi:S1-C subfamily serine protease
VNVLDVALLAFIAFATIGGYRLGLVMRAASWIGLALGIIVAAHFAPQVIGGFSDDPGSSANRWLIAAGLFLGAAFAGQALGLLIGSSFHRVVLPGPLRQLDRIGGAVAAFVGVVVAIWMLLPSLADVPGWPAEQARNSVVARAIDGTLPQPPDTLQALRRLVGPEAFPKVFDALRPAPIIGPPPAVSGLTTAIADRVSASTVRVEGIACRRIQDGSGFTPATDVIVTNAHVVAGEKDTTVIRPDGRKLKATVAVFDANRDLAVLRVPGLDEAPLAVGVAKAGVTGAVFGHPNGQVPLAIAPAAIRQKVTAVGRDLYDQRETRRQIFILASDLHPGDSGGGLVDHNGTIVGVAFAIAPDRPGTAYALTSDELRAVLAVDRSGKVSTGPCVAG